MTRAEDLGRHRRRGRLAVRRGDERGSQRQARRQPVDRAGIESRVLKGVALAHTAYDDPADRVFADVDLLVPGDELTRAATVLTAALGAERPVPEIRPGFDDRFGKEAMLKVDGLELDLHRTFVELAAQSQKWKLTAQDLRQLSTMSSRPKR